MHSLLFLSYLFLHSSWHVFVSDRRACACAKLGSQLETFWPPASNIFAKHFVWPDAAQLSSARLGSRLLICNELCMPRLAVRIGSIVGRWYNRIVGELLAAFDGGAGAIYGAADRMQCIYNHDYNIL